MNVLNELACRSQSNDATVQIKFMWLEPFSTEGFHFWFEKHSSVILCSMSRSPLLLVKEGNFDEPLCLGDNSFYREEFDESEPRRLEIVNQSSGAGLVMITLLLEKGNLKN